MEKKDNDAVWQEYEREKEKLRKLDLPYAEYERRLREIAERLGI